LLAEEALAEPGMVAEAALAALSLVSAFCQQESKLSRLVVAVIRRLREGQAETHQYLTRYLLLAEEAEEALVHLFQTKHLG
jgi:hypothetical protein